MSVKKLGLNNRT